MDNAAILTLFRNAGKLKDTKRAGWSRVGIQDPESIADHSFRCTFMAMILGDDLDVDSEKLLKMTVLHDIAECIIGDITPHDGLSASEKHEMEKNGIMKLLKDLPKAQTYLDLWMEYETQEGKEARLVKDMDKLEMALSAMEYQNKYPNLNLVEFMDEAERQINDPKILGLLAELKKQGRATSR